MNEHDGWMEHDGLEATTYIIAGVVVAVGLSIVLVMIAGGY